MCGLDEGAADQVQGKNKKPLKKLRKSFGDSENSRIFAAVLQHVRNAMPNGLQGFASLAQLARARDL